MDEEITILYCPSEENDRMKRSRQCGRKVPESIHGSWRILLQWQIRNQKKVSNIGETNSLYYQQNISEPVFEEE